MAGMRIVSHRGIGCGHRENSLDAFANALSLGATVIELDLRCTADGTLVLAHNKDMGAWGRPDIWISNHRYEDLQRITGSKEGGLVTFESFLNRFPDTSTILDIKWRGGMETLQTLHTFVRDHVGMDHFSRNHSMLVWLPEHLAAAQQLFPGIRIVDNRVDCAKALCRAMAGLSASNAGSPRIVSIPAQCFRSTRLARRLVHQLRSADHLLMAYLATRADEVAAASALKVDLLMTDDFTLVQHLSENGTLSSTASAGVGR